MKGKKKKKPRDDVQCHVLERESEFGLIFTPRKMFRFCPMDMKKKINFMDSAVHAEVKAEQSPIIFIYPATYTTALMKTHGRFSKLKKKVLEKAVLQLRM